MDPVEFVGAIHCALVEELPVLSVAISLVHILLANFPFYQTRIGRAAVRFIIGEMWQVDIIDRG